VSVGPLLLTVPQVAEALQVNRNKVWALVGSGELPSVRIGRSVRVPVTALAEWVEAQTVSVSAAATATAVTSSGPLPERAVSPNGRSSGAAAGAETSLPSVSKKKPPFMRNGG
jgi:excisionase family DNA binding protein